MITTETRRQRLLELVRTRDFASQDELKLALLNEEIEVTQATLSRDLSRLGIVRVPTKAGTFYRVISRAENHNLLTLVKLEVQEIISNENIIFIRTLPGRAQGVAWYLDGQETELILGTIAGDDGVVVYPRSILQINELKLFLQRLVEIPEYNDELKSTPK